MKRTLLVVGALLAAGAYPAFGQDTNACASIPDSLQRLDCFDKLFPRPPADQRGSTSKTEDERSVSAWQVSEEKSPLDDSIKFSAGLTPSNVSTSGIGDAQMFLILRCAENTTSVILTTSMFMMSEDPVVTIRVGDAPAKTETWNRATNYKAVGLWSGAQAIPFMKSLKDNTRLAVRIQDSDRVDAEFNLSDVSSQVDKVKGYCKW